MATLCALTGTLRDRQGNTVNSATIGFAFDRGVVGGGDVYSPVTATTTTGASGEISVSLYSGAYIGSLVSNGRQETFRLAVPELASADIADYIDDTPTGYNPALLAQAVAARDAALAAQAAAETAETNAETAETGAVVARGAAETARDQAVAAASLAGTTIYDDTAAGIAATSDTEYFLAYQGPGLGRYLNNAGTPVLQQWYIRVSFDDFAALDAFSSTLPAGMILKAWKEGYTYETTASGEDFTTTGGLDVKVIEDTAGVFHGGAFGMVAGNSVDNTTAWYRLWGAMTARAAISDGGGAPTVLLPRGVIKITPSTAVVPPSGTIIRGCGWGVSSSGTADTSSKGTWLVAEGTGEVFSTGQALNSHPTRGTVNVQWENFVILRGETYIGTPGDDPLFGGHGPSRYRFNHVQILAGQAPAVEYSNPWDCVWTDCEFIGGGKPTSTTPDPPNPDIIDLGKPCVGLLISTNINNAQNGNSNRFIACRWEGIKGPMITVEGNHNTIMGSKLHAGANEASTTGPAVPAIKIDSNSAFIGNQLVNFQGSELVTDKCSTFIELKGEGNTIIGNNFRNNGALNPLVTLVGANVFSGSHSIAYNSWDEGGAALIAIQDNRTAGSTITLGPEETYRFSGTPVGVSDPNVTAVMHMGGQSPDQGTTAYFEKSSAGGGGALVAHYSNGSGSNDLDLAALLKSGNFQRPVAIVEQTRTSGSTAPELQIRTGKATTDGRFFINGVADTAGAAPVKFAIGHNGFYYVDGIPVVGAQEPAIADPNAITAYTAATISDPPTQAEVQAIADALETLRGEVTGAATTLTSVLGAMRNHGSIAT